MIPPTPQPGMAERAAFLTAIAEDGGLALIESERDALRTIATLLRTSPPFPEQENHMTQAQAEFLEGGLYRIAQGVMNPAGAARMTLEEAGLPVPPQTLPAPVELPKPASPEALLRTSGTPAPAVAWLAEWRHPGGRWNWDGFYRDADEARALHRSADKEHRIRPLYFGPDTNNGDES